MSTDVVGSAFPTFPDEQLMPSKRGYGQNGFAGASSDMPGENTKSYFLPGADAVSATAETVGGSDGAYAGGRSGKWAPRGNKGGHIQGPQTRRLGNTGKEAQVPVAFGMRGPAPSQ